MPITKEYVDRLKLKPYESIAVREGERTYLGHYMMHSDSHIHVFYDAVPDEHVSHVGAPYTHRLNEIDDVYPVIKDVRRTEAALVWPELGD
ncbi:MAG: hypothetical protein HY514_02875 [Candidatus Aenigmarchaeota archaeon]|nr:hypothetical protein [Candidatus Aenigmarchaeota archaeon]